jgi:coatomer subunit epsilon
MADPLFSIRKNFFIGAHNTIINEAAEIDNLSEHDAIERDVFMYRSYVALGSYEVRASKFSAEIPTAHLERRSFNLRQQLVISEIKDSAATGLQAVKLLAQYLSEKKPKVST